MEQHLKETEVTERDGFVNIAMFTGVREDKPEEETMGAALPDGSGSGGDYSG